MADEPAPADPARADRAPADPARAALARARELAKARAAARGARSRAGTGGLAAGRPARASGGPSQPADPGTDPVRLAVAVRRLLDERGWQGELAASAVLARWDEIAGADLAAHCRPVSVVDGMLVLEAESHAWASELRLLARTVLDRIAGEAGPGVVTRLVVRGPGGSRPTGRWRVPGTGGGVGEAWNGGPSA